MTLEHKPLSSLQRISFKVPVWLYRAHLGFLFFGRIIAIVHHGRRSGKRYVSGLEILERSTGELFVFSAWGREADWFRNIEAGGVDELWDGRLRYDQVSYRVVEPDEAYDVLVRYEHDHAKTAKQTLTRMMPGYDFGAEQRQVLADAAAIVAFRPAAARPRNLRS